MDYLVFSLDHCLEVAQYALFMSEKAFTVVGEICN